MDLNKVCVIGRMTRDLGEKDFGYTTNGKAKLSFSIAVNDGYGENKSVSYFDVVLWGKPAESIKGYLHKGKQLGIEGRLKQDRWEKDGRTNTRVYIIADNVQLLGGDQASQPKKDDGGFPEDVPF